MFSWFEEMKPKLFIYYKEPEVHHLVFTTHKIDNKNAAIGKFKYPRPSLSQFLMWYPFVAGQYGA